MQNDADTCICHEQFIKDNQEFILIIAVYFGDLPNALNNNDTLQLEQKRLGERLEMEEESEVHYILGIYFMLNRKKRLLTIDQHAFLSSVLKRFSMEDFKPVATPLESGAKLKNSMTMKKWSSLNNSNISLDF